jgi:hypothetical protein
VYALCGAFLIYLEYSRVKKINNIDFGKMQFGRGKMQRKSSFYRFFSAL